MGVIQWYVIFAITTALTAHYELVYPVLDKLSVAEPKHNLVEYKWITHIIFLIINMLMAPAMLLPCILPGMGARFKDALFEALIKRV